MGNQPFGVQGAKDMKIVSKYKKVTMPDRTNVPADNKAGNDFWEQQGFAIRDDLVYRELSL